MQSFDAELERFVREGTVDLHTALQYATNEGNLRLSLTDLAGDSSADSGEQL
jgi:Tfp pilus assembly ATPase PilU